MEAMQLQPKPSDYPRIRKALSFYKVTSVITGVMLLLLCAVMVMKYAFNVQLFLFTADGFAHFYPLAPEGLESEFQAEGFDLFKAILIAHGWFYVVYLISDFLLWSPMRWHFGRFLLIALGGVIPFMSFFLEARIVREVRSFLDSREAAPAAAAPAEA
jgi:integral membrane protein